MNTSRGSIGRFPLLARGTLFSPKHAIVLLYIRAMAHRGEGKVRKAEASEERPEALLSVKCRPRVSRTYFITVYLLFRWTPSASVSGHLLRTTFEKCTFFWQVHKSRPANKRLTAGQVSQTSTQEATKIHFHQS